MLAGDDGRPCEPRIPTRSRTARSAGGRRRARDRRRADDHLCLVAGMGRDQTRKLRRRRHHHTGDPRRRRRRDRPPRIGEATFERLRHQAELQVKGDGRVPPLYELLPGAPGHDTDETTATTPAPRGLAALPGALARRPVPRPRGRSLRSTAASSTCSAWSSDVDGAARYHAVLGPRPRRRRSRRSKR